ncbi:hypothetical protein QZH41_014643, partial [Actinostola sp. cb2023]
MGWRKRGRSYDSSSGVGSAIGIKTGKVINYATRNTKCRHDKCKSWCRFSNDPLNYRHSDLPGGKDLKGDDLRASIEDSLRPFLTKQAAAKMAPGGSSQPNECLNSVIGSKAP